MNSLLPTEPEAERTKVLRAVQLLKPLDWLTEQDLTTHIPARRTGHGRGLLPDYLVHLLLADLFEFPHTRKGRRPHDMLRSIEGDWGPSCTSKSGNERLYTPRSLTTDFGLEMAASPDYFLAGRQPSNAECNPSNLIYGRLHLAVERYYCQPFALDSAVSTS